MDWDFNVILYDDPKKFEFFGRMKHYRNDQKADLEVLDPKKIPTEWSGVKDLEVTIVHELLHTRLIFCPAPKKGDNHFLEMAIETISKTLVAHRRGITPEELH